eukprot:478298_1
MSSQPHDSTVLSTIFKEITQELIESNHNQEDIVNGIKDVKFRLEWDIKSFCSIFSQSERKWFKGEIFNIYHDNETNEEWLAVKYKHKQTDVQRFCAAIKPLNFDTNYDNEIVLYIAKKLKEKHINPQKIKDELKHTE